MKSRKTAYCLSDWLPTNKKEILVRNWDELDIILFTGDAYIDHPAFGASVIGRVLENEGLHVAIVPQPNWRDDLRDFKKLGRPRIFFGVTSGSMDSMVNHYTANKRLRSDDAYTPGGKAGFRPDYATTVYSKILKKIYPDVPVIIGGIEASLRRLTHYDYWSDSLKQSILIESKADMLVYGMGEQPIREIIRLMQKGVPFESLKTIPQTAYIHRRDEKIVQNKNWDDLYLSSYEDCLADKIKFAEDFKRIEKESNAWNSKRIIQESGDFKIVVNPPFTHISEREADTIYDLPYTRMPHPRYHKKGIIPAYEMIKHSINIHRGCFGGCSFCTISAHQGKFISSRSENSILKEVAQITKMPDFKGHITDVGGPTANMYKMTGSELALCKKCKKYSCIFPEICKNLNASHQALIDLYKKIRRYPGIKKVTIGSGIRYDLFMTGRNPESDKEYFEELVKFHVSGRLKVAPEHTSEQVLKLMRKPSFSYFSKLYDSFYRICKDNNLKQQLIPYLMSAHPGCTMKDMNELVNIVKRLKIKPEQVQIFTPTPMTLSSVMFYTGINPYTMEKVHIAKSMKERQLQHKTFFRYKREQ